MYIKVKEAIFNTKSVIGLNVVREGTCPCIEVHCTTGLMEKFSHYIINIKYYTEESMNKDYNKIVEEVFKDVEIKNIGVVE